MRDLYGQICTVLLLFSFLYLACSLPTALVDTRKCKKSNGDFPKSGSFCRSFYRCSHWIPVEMTCPLDQHFFPAKGYCVWPEEFPCLDKPNSEHCPEPNGKFLKPSTNCKVYYDCYNGRPSKERCPGDTLFDITSKKCDWPELVACPDETNSEHCPEPNGKFLKPGTHCEVYYDCCNGRPSKKMCPGDTLFDITSKKCDWPELVACPDDQDPGSKVCPLANGNFLKPGSKCKYYYECNNFKATLKKCWGDTIFDQTTGKCDWTELVDCAGDDSTTEKIFPPTLASSTGTDPFTPSSSTEDRISTSTSHPTSSKTLTPDSDEDSSEKGKTSEENKEYTTKNKIKSTYPTIYTVSSTIFEKITTPIIFTEDLKETPSSTKEKPTDFPATSHESSTVATSTETKSRITTVVSTVSEMSTRATSSIDVTTYPAVLTDKTSTKTTINYKDKDSTTTTSSPTDAVTYHIFCPQPDGYFPHPSNKHQFVACVGGNPTIMDCPSKLVYDHKRRSCQYEKKKNLKLVSISTSLPNLCKIATRLVEKEKPTLIENTNNKIQFFKIICAFN